MNDGRESYAVRSVMATRYDAYGQVLTASRITMHN